MGRANPKFPGQVWDGLTPNTQRASISDDQWCNHQDWDQIREEVRAVQTYVLTLDTDGEVLTATADSNINDLRILRILSNGNVEQADPDQGNVIGIALSSAAIGEDVSFKTSGKIVSTSWALTTGAVYYLTAQGTISTTPPSSGFIIRVGQAVATDTLDLRIHPSVRL